MASRLDTVRGVRFDSLYSLQVGLRAGSSGVAEWCYSMALSVFGRLGALGSLHIISMQNMAGTKAHRPFKCYYPTVQQSQQHLSGARETV